MNYGFNDAKEKVEMFSKKEAYNDLDLSLNYDFTTYGVVKRFASDAVRLVNHRFSLNATIMSEIGVTSLAVGQSIVIGLDAPEFVKAGVKGYSQGYFQTLSHLERSISDDVNISMKAEFIGFDSAEKMVYRIQNDGYSAITFSNTDVYIDATIIGQNVVIYS